MIRNIISPVKKEKISIFLCLASFIVGVGLLIAGFCVPPQGAINSSVLIAGGELLTFVAALIGVDYLVKDSVKEEIKDLKEQLIKNLQSEESEINE